jgi:hypothetical protein
MAVKSPSVTNMREVRKEKPRMTSVEMAIFRSAIVLLASSFLFWHSEEIIYIALDEV